MTDRIRVALVYASDFERVSPGGITSSIQGIVAYLGDKFQFMLVGVGSTNAGYARSARGDSPRVVGLPVLAASRRVRFIPLNIVFTARLFLVRMKVLRQADLIHAHRMESTLPFIVGKTKPVILTVHGASKYHVYLRTGLLHWRVVQKIYDLVEGFVFSRVDRVILVSNEGLEYYSERYPGLRHKFVVIPNSIDVSAFSPIDRTKARSLYGLDGADLVVVYVGRLSREKQVDLLIRAFARLSQEHPSAHLLIAGDGPELERLRLVVARSQAGGVRFLGMLARDEIRVLLSCADALVLPSVFEGFPMAVLEALSCGVPVLATDVGGVREILTGGLKDFILRTADPEVIKDKILDAAGRREEIAELCLARARQFDSREVLRRLEDLYLDLVMASSRGRR